MLVLKSSPNAFKSFPNCSHSDILQNSPKSHQSFQATFLSKFGAKNFQNSPNLVTLLEGLKIGYYEGHQVRSLPNRFLNEYFNQIVPELLLLGRYLCQLWLCEVRNSCLAALTHQCVLNINGLSKTRRWVVVATQLVAWSLPSLKVHSSNPLTSKFDICCQQY